MARVVMTDVQHAEGVITRVFLREINTRLRQLAEAINLNARSQWEDLRFPAAGLPFGPTVPGVDTTHGTLLFHAPAGPTESVFAHVQMPHAWEEGGTIIPHVHWTKTTTGTTGDVHWQLDYKHYDIAAVGDAAFTTLSAETTVGGTPDNDTAQEHLITRFGEIDMTGRTVSDMLICQISRVAATGTEYSADAQLIEFDVHYERNSNGSVGEFDKDGL